MRSFNLMENKSLKKVHFIGIGGIGMSALAQHYQAYGVTVSGSDRESSPTTELLDSKGIKIIIGHDTANVPTDADKVVYSDSVPEDNAERIQARSLGIDQISYFRALGQISEGKLTIAVAGTHGKTTTTGMLAKILKDAGESPTAIIGSIVKDFNSNYLKGDSEIFVVEACEYRDHMLELLPQVLVITNLEWDHTDYFPSLEALQKTFRKAIMRVPESGAIVTDVHNPHIAPLLTGAQAKIIDYTQESTYDLRLPGVFNQMNARAAVAAARAVSDLPSTAIAASLAAFHGTWRRFEYKGITAQGAEVYDDYAHHPTAVRETLKALRAKVSSGKIVVAFHPHLYSRTRDLLDDFATAFVDANRVLVAPIYAAREVDDGTISNAVLAERIKATGIDAVACDSFDAIQAELKQYGKGDTIMTMGAGDIYKVADALVQK